MESNLLAERALGYQAEKGLGFRWGQRFRDEEVEQDYLLLQGDADYGGGTTTATRFNCGLHEVTWSAFVVGLAFVGGAFVFHLEKMRSPCVETTEKVLLGAGAVIIILCCIHAFILWLISEVSSDEMKIDVHFNRMVAIQSEILAGLVFMCASTLAALPTILSPHDYNNPNLELNDRVPGIRSHPATQLMMIWIPVPFLLVRARVSPVYHVTWWTLVSIGGYYFLGVNVHASPVAEAAVTAISSETNNASTEQRQYYWSPEKMNSTVLIHLGFGVVVAVLLCGLQGLKRSEFLERKCKQYNTAIENGDPVSEELLVDGKEVVAADEAQRRKPSKNNDNQRRRRHQQKSRMTQAKDLVFLGHIVLIAIMGFAPGH